MNKGGLKIAISCMKITVEGVVQERFFYWLNQAHCNHCLHPPGSSSSSCHQRSPKPQVPIPSEPVFVTGSSLLTLYSKYLGSITTGSKRLTMSYCVILAHEWGARSCYNPCSYKDKLSSGWNKFISCLKWRCTAVLLEYIAGRCSGAFCWHSWDQKGLFTIVKSHAQGCIWGQFQYLHRSSTPWSQTSTVTT